MKVQKAISKIILTISLIVIPALAWGWGKTGHCLVGSVAAQILASEGREMFERHRFDLCYYNNVPDLIWKAPSTYSLERSEHFFDLEPVLEDLKAQEKTLKDLPRSRSALKGELLKHGFAPWRVQELDERLHALSQQLKNSPKNHQEIQGEWLLVAGVLGHYIADLAQPLHCTANYDGQLTGQKGLHEFYESVSVDKLHPELEAKVLKSALSRWKKFSKSAATAAPFDLSVALCQSSLSRVPEVLKIDKKMGRKNSEAFAKAAARSLEESLVLGALHLAEIWRRSSEWNYDGKRFFLFKGAPAHIPPGPIKGLEKSDAKSSR